MINGASLQIEENDFDIMLANKNYQKSYGATGTSH